MNALRSLLYALARLLGDANAVHKAQVFHEKERMCSGPIELDTFS